VQVPHATDRVSPRFAFFLQAFSPRIYERLPARSPRRRTLQYPFLFRSCPLLFLVSCLLRLVYGTARNAMQTPQRVQTVLLTFVTLFMALRVFTRLGLMKALALDDYLSIVAYVSWSCSWRRYTIVCFLLTLPKVVYLARAITLYVGLRSASRLSDAYRVVVSPALPPSLSTHISFEATSQHRAHAIMPAIAIATLTNAHLSSVDSQLAHDPPLRDRNVAN
jgi:hypothetical protein